VATKVAGPLSVLARLNLFISCVLLALVKCILCNTIILNEFLITRNFLRARANSTPSQWPIGAIYAVPLNATVPRARAAMGHMAVAFIGK